MNLELPPNDSILVGNPGQLLHPRYQGAWSETAQGNWEYKMAAWEKLYRAPPRLIGSLEHLEFESQAYLGLCCILILL